MISRFFKGSLEHELFLLRCILVPLWTVYWCFTNATLADLLLLYTAVAIGGLHISMFAHRCWSHRAWKPSKWLNRYGLFMHTIGFFNFSSLWVMVHRWHHHTEDTPEDPHSPYYMPRWRIIFYPRIRKYRPEYIKDLVKDRDHVFFSRYFYHINIAVWIVMYAIDPSMSLLGFWFAFLGAYSLKQRLINSIGHADPVNKGTCNRPIWAWIYLDGEPWHDNHSREPGNWKFYKHWWQIDVSAYCIWIFTKLGWATATQQRFRKFQ